MIIISMGCDFIKISFHFMVLFTKHIQHVYIFYLMYVILPSEGMPELDTIKIK